MSLDQSDKDPTWKEIGVVEVRLYNTQEVDRCFTNKPVADTYLYFKLHNKNTVKLGKKKETKKESSNYLHLTYTTINKYKEVVEELLCICQSKIQIIISME